MKKGFIFTIDALAAILSTFIFITISFWYFSHVQTLNWNDPALYQFTQDSLAVLDMNGDLIRDTQIGNASIQQFLNSMPGNICGSISVYNMTNDNNPLHDFTVTKANCQQGKKTTIARRSFAINYRTGNRVTVMYHYAQMEAWFT